MLHLVVKIHHFSSAVLVKIRVFVWIILETYITTNFNRSSCRPLIVKWCCTINHHVWSYIFYLYLLGELFAWNIIHLSCAFSWMKGNLSFPLRMICLHRNASFTPACRSSTRIRCNSVVTLLIWYANTHNTTHSWTLPVHLGKCVCVCLRWPAW